jgi:hypothetical protein
MMHFFTSRELSRCLGIPLSRWKRWARDFLPPDPLGGRQSGYARQYNFNQAFQVYLGGFLVNHLKFPVPEALQIIRDTRRWMKAHGFYIDFAEPRSDRFSPGVSVRYYLLYVLPVQAPAESEAFPWGYRVRARLDDGREALRGGGENWMEWIPCRERIGMDPALAEGGRLMNLSRLRNRFVACLESLDAAAQATPT